MIFIFTTVWRAPQSDCSKKHSCSGNTVKMFVTPISHEATYEYCNSDNIDTRWRSLKSELGGSVNAWAREKEEGREGERERAQQKTFPKVRAELSLWSEWVRRGYSPDWATAALQCGTATNLHPTLLSSTQILICRHHHVLPLLLDTGTKPSPSVPRCSCLHVWVFPVCGDCTRFTLQTCVVYACAAACHLLWSFVFVALHSSPV